MPLFLFVFIIFAVEDSISECTRQRIAEHKHARERFCDKQFQVLNEIPRKTCFHVQGVQRRRRDLSVVGKHLAKYTSYVTATYD